MMRLGEGGSCHRGSCGIGRAIALALESAGARVSDYLARQRDAAEAVVQALRQVGSDGQIYQFDVADYVATTAAFAQIVDDFGRLDSH
jgi:NAD(P)-dependent dehydrogenase (short-subunit alcohol dehydrogenase family)